MLFPAPLCPMTPSDSPRATSKLTSRSATTRSVAPWRPETHCMNPSRTVAGRLRRTRNSFETASHVMAAVMVRSRRRCRAGRAGRRPSRARRRGRSSSRPAAAAPTPGRRRGRNLSVRVHERRDRAQREREAVGFRRSVGAVEHRRQVEEEGQQHADQVLDVAIEDVERGDDEADSPTISSSSISRTSGQPEQRRRRMAAVERADAEQDRQTHQVADQVRERAHDDQRRGVEGRPADEVAVADEERAGTAEAAAEPAPRQQAAEDERRIRVDPERDDALEEEHQHEELRERQEQRPGEPERRVVVAEPEIAPHEMADDLDAVKGGSGRSRPPPPVTRAPPHGRRAGGATRRSEREYSPSRPTTPPPSCATASPTGRRAWPVMQSATCDTRRPNHRTRSAAELAALLRVGAVRLG